MFFRQKFLLIMGKIQNRSKLVIHNSIINIIFYTSLFIKRHFAAPCKHKELYTCVKRLCMRRSLLHHVSLLLFQNHSLISFSLTLSIFCDYLLRYFQNKADNGKYSLLQYTSAVISGAYHRSHVYAAIFIPHAF